MKRLAAVSLTVVVAGTGFWLSHHRGDPAVTRAQAIHPSADNLTDISTLADERVARAASLHAEGKGIRGEGIDMPEPGTLAFTSFNGAHITQRVAAADVVDRDGQRRALARQPSEGVATGDGQKSQARFADFFAGLDLEYTWDGRDIEEFFHLDDGLRQDVVRSGGSLVLTTVFPGLDPKNAALQNMRKEAPDPRTLAKGQPLPAPPLPGQPIDARGEVELYADLGRFILPPAVAIDGADHRSELDRRFAFTSQGLEVAVTVPASWLATTEGRVVIDPSVIDNRRTINLNDGNSYGYSIVRDSLNRLHVVYAAVYDGSWSVAYSSSSNNGISWTRPTRVFSGTSTVYYLEPPTLAIDSENTLHTAWSMYGEFSNDDGTVDTLDGNNFASLVRYARCSDGCGASNWQFQGNPSGKFLTQSAASNTWEWGPRIAIDANDTAHLMYMVCSNDCFLTYLTIDADENITADLEAPGQYLWDYGLFIDPTNTPNVYYSDYACTPSNGCRYLLRRAVYDTNLGAWADDGEFDARQSSFANNALGICGNDNEAYLYGISGSVGPDGLMHIGFSIYNGCNGYFPAHVAYDTGADRFTDAVFVKQPDSSSGRFIYASNPLVTVDRENDVHFLWNERDTRNTLFVAKKTAGTELFSAPEQLLRAGNASPVKALCSKYFPAFMRGVDGENLSILVVFGGNSLQYLSTGAPLDAPVPSAPRNHSYTDTTTPNFSWLKLRNDPGTFDYLVEVDESPLFNTPSLTALRSNRAATVRFEALAGLSLRDEGCYYWRVRAENSVGSGPFSEPFEFCVDTTPPQPVRLIAPADGSDPGTRTPTFIWEPAR